ncbi:MAG: hypothetical protein AAGI68_16025 [Planctomycetota bacterium]
MVALLVVVLGLGVYAWVQREGSSGLERWVGERVLGFVNERLGPELVFEDLDYQAPTTVVLRNIRLRAADPDRPGQTVDIVESAVLRIELAETPKQGKPLVIRSLRLESPTVRLIHGLDGGLIGFDNLAPDTSEPRPAVVADGQTLADEPVRGAEDADGNSGTAAVPEKHPSAELTEAVGDAMAEVRSQFSDWLRFEEIELKDARVEYADRREAEGTGLVLDRVSTRLRLDQSSPGDYGLTLSLGRGELLGLRAELVLDLDDLELRLRAFELEAAVSPEELTALPPQLGSIVKRYGISGRLRLDGRGTIDLEDWTASELLIELLLGEGRVVLRERMIDLDELRASITIGAGELVLERLGVRTMSGRLDATGRIGLGETYPAELVVSGDGLRLDTVLVLLGDERVESAADEPASGAATQADGLASQRVWGRLGLDVAVVMQGSDPLATLSGGGQATLEDAELTAFRGAGRILGALAESMRLKRRRTLAERESAPGDRLRLEFTLEGDKAVFARDGIRLSTPGLVAARGYGTVWLNGGLDVFLNAGPFERVQELIGRAGDLWDRLTGGLARYHLTGTLAEPQVALVIVGVETRRAASTQPAHEADPSGGDVGTGP